jgi:hypothetical protein
MLLAVSTFAAVPCDAASLLNRLGGEWSGKGTSRDVGAAESERIACRLGVQVPDSGSRADADGRCATASGTVRFSIEIAPDDGRELFAVVATSLTPNRTGYSVRERGQNLTFFSRAPVTIKGQLYDSSIVIRFHGNSRFAMSHMVNQTGSAEKLMLFSAEFARKGRKEK